MYLNPILKKTRFSLQELSSTGKKRNVLLWKKKNFQVIEIDFTVTNKARCFLTGLYNLFKKTA